MPARRVETEVAGFSFAAMARAGEVFEGGFGLAEIGARTAGLQISHADEAFGGFLQHGRRRGGGVAERVEEALRDARHVAPHRERLRRALEAIVDIVKKILCEGAAFALKKERGRFRRRALGGRA